MLTPPVDVAARDLLQEICAKHGYEVKGLEVMPDHIHLFISVPPARAVATVVKLIKGASARMLFVWQVSSETIQRYIERQEKVAEEQ